MIKRLVIDPAVCTGCSACIDSCPTDVLRYDPVRRKAFVAFAADCQGCRLCVIDCPVDAIELDSRIEPAYSIEELVKIY